MSEKVPVLIAARNEGEHIGDTLSALPTEVEAIVIVNGCTDNTAEIAAQHNATVIVSPVEGKLPAIQTGLRHLGERALGPIITLDADSRPVMPRRWIESLLTARNSLGAAEPACVVGNSVYVHANPLRAAMSTVAHWRMVARTAHDPRQGYFHGRNMMLDLMTEGALEDVLALPHIWPGEDEALKDVVLTHGGNVVKALDVRGAVLTTADRYASFLTRLRLGRQVCQDIYEQSYLDEAAPGSVALQTYRISDTPSEEE